MPAGTPHGTPGCGGRLRAGRCRSLSHIAKAATSTTFCWLARVAMADGAGFFFADAPPVEPWPEPDMRVLRLNRRPPPQFPLQVLGSGWDLWIAETAEAAACPSDYVAMALLSSASALIGNARWAAA